MHYGFDYYFGKFYDPGGETQAFYENLERVAELDDTDKNGTKKMVPAALKFLQDNKDKPFFLYYASHIPHSKWIPHADFAGSSKQGAYGDCVQQLDWAVGKILNELETLGLKDNTLVIFTSDNGAQLNAPGYGSCAPLRDGKWTNFEGGIRVPCIMKWPGKIAAGSVNEEITAIFDMLPTFCAITGEEVPSDRVIDGKNILPYMLGQNVKTPIHDTFTTGSTIRYKDWKLYLKKEMPGGNGTKGMQGRTPAEEGSLFNLKEDIGETSNVASQYPEKVKELRKLAEKYKAESSKGMRPPKYVEGFDEETVKRLQQEKKQNKRAKNK